MFTFAGFLILLVIALATATGILAHENSFYSRGYRYRPVQNYMATHVPVGDKYALLVPSMPALLTVLSRLLFVEAAYLDRTRFNPGYEDSCDGISRTFGHMYGTPRNMGPSVNSTCCSWCTIDWFNCKLLSWKKDEIKDSKTGKDVELLESLKRICNTGQRCDADAWNRTWARAIRHYKLSGELPDDWEKEEESNLKLGSRSSLHGRTE